MKKLLSLALLLTMILVLAVPVLASPSYDSTVRVDITPDDAAIVLYGDAVEVTFTVSVGNISKSGDLPQVVVTPLGDNTEGLTASQVTKIVNKATGVFEFSVTYTQVGTYDFWVNIKNMQGNSGKWNYEFTAEKVSVTIVAPPQEEGLPEGFTVSGNGLAITKDALNIGDFASNGKELTVTLNGTPLNLNSNVTVNANGITIKKFEVGTYVVTNTTTGQTFTFKVELVDGNNSVIQIID